jgi:hypothetical protein
VEQSFYPQMTQIWQTIFYCKGKACTLLIFHVTVFHRVAICFALGVVLIGCQKRQEKEDAYVSIADLRIVTLELPSAEQNAYIVRLDNSKDCLIVDAGYDADQIIHTINRHRLNPVAILVTHLNFCKMTNHIIIDLFGNSK